MSCYGKNLNERKFRPNFKIKPLTEKFYARHDSIQIDKRNLKRYEHFANEIEKLNLYDSREHYYAPITENQTYGWLERFADKYSGMDEEILMHKIPQDEMMRILKQISVDMEREKLIKRL